eukprot:10452250-Alexandrium_andersonii.AAC.1
MVPVPDARAGGSAGAAASQCTCSGAGSQMPWHGCMCAGTPPGEVFPVAQAWGGTEPTPFVSHVSALS